MEKKRTISWLAAAILSLCTAFSLCMSYAVPEGAVSVESCGLLANIIDTFDKSLSSDSLSTSLLFIGFMLLYGFNSRRCRDRHILLSLCCLLMAGIWLMGQNFTIDNTMDAMFASPGQLVKSLIYFLGSYNLLRQLCIAAEIFLESSWDIPLTGKLVDLFRRRSFWAYFVLILLVSLPQWIICYPGYMCADAYCSLAYGYGIYEFSSQHPPIYSMLLSWTVKVGTLLGSANLGLYMVVCAQFISFAAVFAYMLYTLHRLKAPNWLLIISLICLAFSHTHIPFATQVIKDNVFSYGVLLFTIELVYLMLYGSEYWKKPGHMLLMAFSVLSVMLFRNNGKHLLYVCIPIIFVSLLLPALRRGEKKLAARGLAVLILPVLLATGTHNFLMSYYDITPGSIAEALSFPFQQTARYAYERGDEIPQEEIDIINRVISFEDIRVDYKPTFSDDVKRWYNAECSGGEFVDYLKVWLKQGLRHPEIYLKATMNQNYRMFCPWVEFGDMSINTISEKHTHISGPIGIEETEALTAFRPAIKYFAWLTEDIPLLNTFINVGTCTIMVFLLCVFALKRRFWGLLLVLLPSVLSIGVHFLAPGVLVRFALPYISAMPLFIAFYMHLLREKKALPKK